MLEPDLEKGKRLSCISWTEKAESIVTDTVVDEFSSPRTVVEELPSPTALESHDDDYPDGGWAAWLTVLGAFLALVFTFGQLNSFGTFQSWYSEHQLSNLPASTISWIGSVQLWVFFFSVRV